jgi:serine/threonine protein kinase
MCQGNAVAVDAGAQLGPYRIEAVLGEGGMGVVYCALDTTLKRPVAVKFLFDDSADPAARRRFQQEAQPKAVCCSAEQTKTENQSEG